jgi:hypothetical protein
MSRSPAVALAAICAVLPACASAPAPAPPVTVAVPLRPAPSAAVAPSPPPIEIALPKDAAATGSMDLSRLDTRALDPALAQPLVALSNLFDLDPAKFAAMMNALRIDIRRPLAFAVAGPSDEQREAIEALRSLVGSGPVSSVPAPVGTYEKLRAAMTPVSTLVAVRILVPTLDAARLKTLIGTALGHGWHVEGTGEYSRPPARIAVSGDGDTLVVDVALGRDPKSGIASLRAQVAAGHAAAVALDGRLSAIHFTPSSVAALAFLSGVSVTAQALSGESVDPDQKDRIAAQGLWEAGQALAVAGTGRGAFFDGVDLGATLDGSHLDLIARALPGPAFVGPADALWAPSTSVGPSPLQSAAVIDVSQPFARAWPLPGDQPGGLAKSTFLELMNDAGSVALPVALPLVAASAARALARELARVLPSPDSVDRFERVGSIFTEPHEIAFGLLPAKTPRAVAECILGDPRCAASVRLPVGKVKEVAGASGGTRLYRLVEVDKRYVLLVGRESDREALGMKLVTTPVGPAVLDVGGDMMAKGIDHAGISGLAIGSMSGTIERRGSEVVLHVVTR